MSLFWFDRLQYAETINKLLIFEFFKTDISNINKVNTSSWNNELANEIFDKFTLEKHSLIRKIMRTNNNIIYYIIFYSDMDLDKKILIEYKDNLTRCLHEFDNFKELQSWFININNIDGDSHSKPLGNIQTNTEFAKKILFDYWKTDINEFEDQGLEFTKKLLKSKDEKGNDIEISTKGFDFDLFLYFENSNSLITIELALNKKNKKENFECTPMKYCWGNNPPHVPDNKLKYNKLWQATKLLNGELSILNYSESEKDLGYSIIHNLDYEKGILNETKFIISKTNFINSLISTLSENCLTFNHFNTNCKKVINYDEEFFINWKENRSKYKDLL